MRQWQQCEFQIQGQAWDTLQVWWYHTEVRNSQKHSHTEQYALDHMIN